MAVGRDHRSRLQLFRRALAKNLSDIEIDEIGVMKNDRFNRAFDLVALVTVRSDNVEDFAGDSVLVSERDATERMTDLLSKLPLDHIARRVLIILQRFAHIGQERTGNEIIALNRDAAAEGFLQHISDGDALSRTRVEMFDESHVDVAGQQGELYRAQLIERPALAAVARGDGLAPNRGDLFAQRLVLNLPDAGKELRDFSDPVDGRFVCFHGA